jgi:hypothetical protein
MSTIRIGLSDYAQFEKIGYTGRHLRNLQEPHPISRAVYISIGNTRKSTPTIQYRLYFADSTVVPDCRGGVVNGYREFAVYYTGKSEGVVTE